MDASRSYYPSGSMSMDINLAIEPPGAENSQVIQGKAERDRRSDEHAAPQAESREES